MCENAGAEDRSEPRILARSEEADWGLAEDTEQSFAVRILSEPMRELAPGGAEVSVLFTSDRQIRALNLQYRQIDQPTDVLAFALNEGGQGPGEAASALGDIVVSLEAARAQAAERGVGESDELALLLLHGFLHLIGLDHDTPDSETEMFAVQERWLRRLGFAGFGE